MERLTKNATGRWQIGAYDEITSGEVFEVQLGQHWIRGRMEYLNDRYAMLLTTDDPEVEQVLELKKGWKARRSK